jgi:hypothetical protein
MSGHHPFHRLVENLPKERKIEIEKKKKELLAAIELRESIFNAIIRSSIDSSG